MIRAAARLISLDFHAHEYFVISGSKSFHFWNRMEGDGPAKSKSRDNKRAGSLSQQALVRSVAQLVHGKTEEGTCMASTGGKRSEFGGGLMGEAVPNSEQTTTNQARQDRGKVSRVKVHRHYRPRQNHFYHCLLPNSPPLPRSYSLSPIDCASPSRYKWQHKTRGLLHRFFTTATRSVSSQPCRALSIQPLSSPRRPLAKQPQAPPAVPRRLVRVANCHQESLLEQQEEAAPATTNCGLSLEATLDSDFISDPYYRITPPPSIEGRESPLLFAASFRDAAKDAASSPSINSTMSAQPTNNINNNNEAAPPTRPRSASPAARQHHRRSTNGHQTPPQQHHPQPPPPSPSPNLHQTAPHLPQQRPSPPASENTGRWTAEEHRLFLQGLEEHGKGWKIASSSKRAPLSKFERMPRNTFKTGQGPSQRRRRVDAVEKVVAPPSAGGVVMRTLPNMTLGTDSVSLAAAAGRLGLGRCPLGRKRRTNAQGTKRRAIGSVVRSSVRRRNWKRQKMVEEKLQGNVTDIPNPLPSISNILDPYVMPPRCLGRCLRWFLRRLQKSECQQESGRQQLVHTATHGTLPMAALEDAVPPINTRSRIDQPYIRSTAAESLYSGSPGPEPRQDIRRVHNAPSRTSGGTGHPGAVVPNSSPTCVTDMSTFPSWVDAKNPPAWYNEGSDIDTLLEDAECLNWLSDTGDLDETYPPAVAIASTAVTTEPSMDFEPTPVNVHPYEYAYHGNMDSHSPHPTLAEIHEEPIDPTLVHDPITHPSVESLSFLVDSPKQGMDEMTSFLHDENHAHHAPKHFEAVSDAPEVKLSAEESHDHLMSFPDLDMGDEQAFVSALLDTSKECY
ncbi:hypothetical protein HJC23_004981 [Cyclotella cryptica]|uniref:Myb-like domain-containing protein n=1 Tax=Cyclotella cryptica TaxID=29204 RepID=A0ABD3NLS4_9STRA